MIDMIKELYEGGLHVDRRFSAEYTALCQQEAELVNKIVPLLGMDMVDELSNIQAEITSAANLDWFRAGFRLGASLMLELR